MSNCINVLLIEDNPDYGRRGIVWVHGAFEPATGHATFVLSDRRDGASHLRLLEQILTVFPADRWLLIEDNLSTHHSRDVKTALLAWPEIQIQFLPKYASWLNLIEPWWKCSVSEEVRQKVQGKVELLTPF